MLSTASLVPTLTLRDEQEVLEALSRAAAITLIKQRLAVMLLPTQLQQKALHKDASIMATNDLNQIDGMLKDCFKSRWKGKEQTLFTYSTDSRR